MVCLECSAHRFHRYMEGPVGPRGLLQYQRGWRSEINGHSLSEEEKFAIEFLFNRLNEFSTAGNLIVRPDRFWTTSGSYWRLPYLAPDLFNELKESELVIFNGDLNYRKLTGDVSLDPSRIWKFLLGTVINISSRQDGKRQPHFQTPLGLWASNLGCEVWL